MWLEGCCAWRDDDDASYSSCSNYSSSSKKTRLPENNHNGTHIQRSLQFFFMPRVRCTAHTQTHNID
jgi:hypothetical protein